MQSTFLCANKNGLRGLQLIFVLLFTVKLENLMHLCHVLMKKKKYPAVFYFT